MLNSERVTSTDSAHFPALDALYGRAFPWHEQREIEAKQQALDNPHYELEATLNIWPSTIPCDRAATASGC